VYRGQFFKQTNLSKFWIIINQYSSDEEAFFENSKNGKATFSQLGNFLDCLYSFNYSRLMKTDGVAASSGDVYSIAQ